MKQVSSANTTIETSDKIGQKKHGGSYKSSDTARYLQFYNGKSALPNFPSRRSLKLEHSSRNSQHPTTRRRHSVTSLSTSSSPTLQAPPLKRARIDQVSATTNSTKVLKQLTKPEIENDLDIKPPNFSIQEGELWDDLFDVQVWQSENKATFEKSVDIETWTDDFIILGFSSNALSAFHTIIQRAYISFGPELVNMILQYETVGNIASLMVWGDVMEYSRRNSAGEFTERKDSETSLSPTAASSLQ